MTSENDAMDEWLADNHQELLEGFKTIYEKQWEEYVYSVWKDDQL